MKRQSEVQGVLLQVYWQERGETNGFTLPSLGGVDEGVGAGEEADDLGHVHVGLQHLHDRLVELVDLTRRGGDGRHAEARRRVVRKRLRQHGVPQ